MPIAKAVCAVAMLVEELEEYAIAEMIRDTVNSNEHPTYVGKIPFNISVIATPDGIIRHHKI